MSTDTASGSTSSWLYTRGFLLVLYPLLPIDLSGASMSLRLSCPELLIDDSNKLVAFLLKV